MPVHLGNHWTCAVINLAAKELVYYDSMGVWNSLPWASSSYPLVTRLLPGLKCLSAAHHVQAQSVLRALTALRQWQDLGRGLLTSIMLLYSDRTDAALQCSSLVTV